MIIKKKTFDNDYKKRKPVTMAERRREPEQLSMNDIITPKIYPQNWHKFEMMVTISIIKTLTMVATTMMMR